MNNKNKKKKEIMIRLGKKLLVIRDVLRSDTFIFASVSAKREEGRVTAMGSEKALLIAAYKIDQMIREAISREAVESLIKEWEHANQN